ncbi:hypothetical protein ZWY2020_023738 [Hordeum vulgare]|nr:hypothetical protein ZWY2020_023738 [Hordeum vulgare]
MRPMLAGAAGRAGKDAGRNQGKGGLCCATNVEYHWDERGESDRSRFTGIQSPSYVLSLEPNLRSLHPHSIPFHSHLKTTRTKNPLPCVRRRPPPFPRDLDGCCCSAPSTAPPPRSSAAALDLGWFFSPRAPSTLTADELEGAGQSRGSLGTRPPRRSSASASTCCVTCFTSAPAWPPDASASSATSSTASSPVTPAPPWSPSALEVSFQNFVDINQVRNFTMLRNAIQEGPRVSTMPESCEYELCLILELISRHFISSVQDDAEFDQFFSALSWSKHQH